MADTSPLIVTGCPRSGTTTMAHVLGVLHEQQFSVPKAARNAQDTGVMLQSECAWPAAPFVHLLLSRGCRVVHLVRNPLDCIASMSQRQLLGRGAHVNDAFIRQYAKVPDEDTHLQQLCRMWLAWNRMLSDLKLPRIRIEDVTNAPRKHVAGTHEALGWEQIPEAFALAREYGYGP